MARKTQEEINYWFQDHTIKSGMDLSLIEKILHLNNLDTPNNIIIHKNGLIYDDFARWYCDEVKECIYPKTYEECCEMLGIEEDLWFVYEDIDANHINPACISNYRMRRLDLYHNLEKLLICRDAYWKILGEEMGLGKPWEFENPSRHYVFTIENSGGKIQKNSVTARMLNRILVFPTEEIRDAFYENFKDLIEQCKELL